MQIKRWIVVATILVMVFTGCSSGDSGQSRAEAGDAQLRVSNLFAPLADVSLDNHTLLDGLVYPYTSDYWTVDAGRHILHVAASGDEASLDLALIDGHSYLILAYGDESDPTLELIDETDSLARANEERSSVLILHLVEGAPGLDGYLAGEKVISDLTFGQHTIYEMPLGEADMQITPAGLSSLVVYDNLAYGLPHLYSVVALVGTLLNPRIVITSVSPLDMLDFFMGVAETGGYYDSARDMIEQSGLAVDLAGPGPITVFAPWDSSFVEVPGAEFDAIMADPSRLMDTVRYHIVPERLPPYVLAQRSVLTTVQGSTLTVTSSETEPYFRLNDVAGVYNDYRVSNGILYEVNALLRPLSWQ